MTRYKNCLKYPKLPIIVPTKRLVGSTMNNRISLRESKHPGLYPWALVEIDEGGNNVGPELIPWNYGVYFKVSKVKIITGISGDNKKRNAFDLLPHDRKNWKIGNDVKVLTESTDLIHLTLKTDEPSAFYFLGGKDPICDISVRIDAGEEETCHWTGAPSYGIEVCWTYPRKKYDKLISILSISPEKLGFRFSGVEGLYSKWTPGIHANEIWVLGSPKEQSVEFCHAEQIELPVLGSCRNFGVWSISEIMAVEEEIGDSSDELETSIENMHKFGNSIKSRRAEHEIQHHGLDNATALLQKNLVQLKFIKVFAFFILLIGAYSAVFDA
jgi:hypothetical protein